MSRNTTIILHLQLRISPFNTLLFVGFTAHFFVDPIIGNIYKTTTFSIHALVTSGLPGFLHSTVKWPGMATQLLRALDSVAGAVHATPAFCSTQ
jgi:hypothetical protein